MSTESPNDRLVSILVAGDDLGVEQRRSMFPRPSEVVQQVEVSAERLANGIKDCLESLRNVVQKMPDSLGEYDVDELTFALSINASGKVSLVAEAGIGLSTGITVKVKKRQVPRQ